MGLRREPPSYRISDTAGKSCGTCGYWYKVGGKCRRYIKRTPAKYVCKTWKSGMHKRSSDMSKKSVEVHEHDKRYLEGFVAKCAEAKVDPIETAKAAGINKVAFLSYISRLLGKAPLGNVARATNRASRLGARAGSLSEPVSKDELVSALRQLSQAGVKSKHARRKAMPFLLGTGAGSAGVIGLANSLVDDPPPPTPKSWWQRD